MSYLSVPVQWHSGLWLDTSGGWETRTACKGHKRWLDLEAEHTKENNKLNKYQSLIERENSKSTTNLCNVLRWHNCVAHISASWSWCQDSPWWEVSEVGLDLGNWSCRHDESLLGLSCSYYCCWCQGLRCHLQKVQSINIAQFYSEVFELETFAEGTCLTVCAGTMGTDILTAPAPTTIGLAARQ